MTEKKNYKNFKEFSASYIGGWTFQDGEQTWTISDVTSGIVENHKTKSKEENILVYFQEHDLPLVLNATNAESIKKAVGSMQFRDWIGKRITLYSAKVHAFGDVWDAVRIRDTAPADPVKAEPASGAQLERLRGLIADGTINESAFLKFCKAKRLEDVSKAQAKQAIQNKTGEIVE